MKKLLALLLTLVMAVSVVAVAPTVSAKSKIYKSNNCCYTLDKKGYATVIDYYGPTYESVDYKYAVKYWKIPPKLNGHKVKKLVLENEEQGFHFKKIKIPRTVTYIKGLYSYIKNTATIERYYKTCNFDTLVICDKGSRAESYSRQCGLDYSIKGNIYGDIGYLGAYGFKYYADNKYKTPFGKSDYKYSMKYNGKERKLMITVKKGKQVLKLNRDYTIRWINNMNPGEALAVLEGKGKFYGVTYIQYDIKPTKPKIIIHQNERLSGVCAYYDVPYEGSVIKFIGQYSETSDFKKYKSFDGSDHLANLKKGKTYYFRCKLLVGGLSHIAKISPSNARKITFSQLTFGSMSYNQYSPWSDVKAVKIKYDYSNKQ